LALPVLKNIDISPLMTTTDNGVFTLKYLQKIFLVLLMTIGISNCAFAIQPIKLENIQLLLDDTNGVDGLNNPRIARITLDGSQVLVVSADDDALTIFDVDKDFKLTFNTMFKNGSEISGLRGATKFVLSVDEQQAFLVSFYDSALVIFNRNSQGDFQYQQTISDDLKWFTETGSSLPVVEKFDKLALLGAYDIAITPDNKQLLIASSASNALSIFDLDVNGQVSSKQIIRDSQDQRYALTSAVSVITAQDNKHVFVSSYEENAVTIFTRSNTGELTFLQTLRNNFQEIKLMNNPHSLAISANSKFLYVASNGAVVVFEQKNGKYTYLQTISNNDKGVSGLSGSAGIALTPDGKYVFVASEADSALVTFLRASDGTLHFYSILKAPELEGTSSVTINSDGKYLFVTAGNEGNSLSIFKINRQ